jgi:hypothetical protein
MHALGALLVYPPLLLPATFTKLEAQRWFHQGGLHNFQHVVVSRRVLTHLLLMMKRV